jgi:hypothetical protein
MIKRFDIVVLKTIEHVKWVSGPAGRPATPKGQWIVTAVSQNDMVVLSKDETIIQIPIGDVIMVAEYDLDNVIKKIKDIKPETLLGDNDGEEGREGPQKSGETGSKETKGLDR